MLFFFVFYRRKHDHRRIDIMYDFAFLLERNGLLFYARLVLKAFFFL